MKPLHIEYALKKKLNREQGSNPQPYGSDPRPNPLTQIQN